MKSFLSILSLVLIISSCKKATDVVSREDELRGGGGWRQTSGTVKYRVPFTAQDTTIDYWKSVAECYKDNKFLFKEIHSGIVEYGANRCEPSEPTVRNFFWQLLENDQVLELNYVGDAFFGAEPVHAEIKEFSSSRMVLEYNTRDTLPGQNSATIFTYTNAYSK